MACRGTWWKATVAAAWGAREEERPSGKQAQTVLKMLTFHALTGLQPVSTGWQQAWDQGSDRISSGR